MSTDTKWIIELASLPDRDEVVAEVWHGDEQLAEVRREVEATRVTLFLAQGGAWDFDLDELMSVLQRAKARLIGEFG